MAWRGCPSGRRSFDERRRILEHRDLGIPKSVDRLLAIADDEDRGRQPICRGAEPLAPVSNQLRDEPPLRAARVLKLVHQNVMVPCLESIPAARKLVHLVQEAKCALKHAGKVEQRMRFKSLVIGARRRQRRAILRATARHSDRDGKPEPRRQSGRDGRQPRPMAFPRPPPTTVVRR